MLDKFPIGKKQSTVYRLAAAFKKPLDSVLLERGIDPDSITETRAELDRVGVSFTVEEIVSNSFHRKAGRPKPFRKTRFSDGTIGVFYSAHEISTCKQELVFHLAIQEGDSPRFYCLIDCVFSGATADLRGKENDYPDLVSKTEDGYRFCQHLGTQAKQNNIDAFYTASARKEGGTCVPVFTQAAISKPSITSRVKVTATADGIQFDAM